MCAILHHQEIYISNNASKQSQKTIITVWNKQQGDKLSSMRMQKNVMKSGTIIFQWTVHGRPGLIGQPATSHVVQVPG